MSLTHYDCVELQKKILEKNNLEIELPSNALLKCIFCKKKKILIFIFNDIIGSIFWVMTWNVIFDICPPHPECRMCDLKRNAYVTKDAYKTQAQIQP